VSRRVNKRLSLGKEKKLEIEEKIEKRALQALVLGEALEAYVKIQKGEKLYLALGGNGTGFSTLGMR